MVINVLQLIDKYIRAIVSLRSFTQTSSYATVLIATPRSIHSTHKQNIEQRNI